MENITLSELVEYLPSSLPVTQKLRLITSAPNCLSICITTDDDFSIVNYDDLASGESFFLQRSDDGGYEIIAPLFSESPSEEAASWLTDFAGRITIQGKNGMSERIVGFFCDAAQEVGLNGEFCIGGNQIVEGEVVSDLTGLSIRMPLV